MAATSNVSAFRTLLNKKSATRPTADPTDLIELHVRLQTIAAESHKRMKEEANALKALETAFKSPYRNTRVPLPTISPETLQLLNNHEEDNSEMLKAKLKMALAMHKSAIDSANALGNVNQLKADMESLEKRYQSTREELEKAKSDAALSRSKQTLAERKLQGFEDNLIRLNTELNTKDDEIEVLKKRIAELESKDKQRTSSDLQEKNTKLLNELANDTMSEKREVITLADDDNTPGIDGHMLRPLASQKKTSPNKKTGKRLRKNNNVDSPTKAAKASALTTIKDNNHISASPELPGNQEMLFPDFDLSASQLTEL